MKNKTLLVSRHSYFSIAKDNILDFLVPIQLVNPGVMIYPVVEPVVPGVAPRPSSDLFFRVDVGEIAASGVNHITLW